LKPNVSEEPESSAPVAPIPDAMADFKQKVEKLKVMREAGLLSDEEFDGAKRNLMNSLL
jgi:hypothetical protein